MTRSILKYMTFLQFINYFYRNSYKKMAFRPVGNSPSYYQNNHRLGYSSVSKGFGFGRNVTHQDPHQTGQIQYMLENQRRKFKQVKERLEHQLDNQRKLRIQFENKLIKLKDDFSRKDVQTSELQFKMNNILHQNQDLAVQNNRLQHELARVQEIYGSKIHQLQSQLDVQTKNFEQTTMQYNHQFQKFKKQGQEYVEHVTFDFERKIKNLQEKLKVLQSNKKDLLMDNKKLNDILITNKLNFQQQIRDIKNKSKDQQMKKVQQMGKGFDQKIKTCEEAKEMLARKNQELLRVIQEKERIISDIQSQSSQQVNKLRQDCGDLHGQNNHLNHFLSKLKQEISDKDGLINRTMSSNDGELVALKQQIQQKKQEINNLNSANRDMRSTIKENQHAWQKERRQLVERLNAIEGQARKYKEEYLRICELLKSKINSAIDGVSYRK